MRVAICDNQVPFVSGGAESLRAALCEAFRAAGVEAECVNVPYRWYPSTKIAEAMLLWQLLDVTAASGKAIDRVVALRFPAYLVEHPHRTIWLLHQHRTAYELYDSPFSDLVHFEHGPAAREAVRAADALHLRSARRILAISRTVAGRLKKWNGIEADVLYPPVPGAETFRSEGCGDYVLCAGRLDRLKRQDLLVRAMALTRRPLRCLLAGGGPDEAALQRLAAELGLGDRVKILGRVPAEDLRSLYANALAVVYVPLGEDYGYATLEAFLSGKPVVTVEDGGGTLEFVEDGVNGFVVPPTPGAIAEAIEALAGDPARAVSMGRNGRDLVRALDLSWGRVVESLLA